jgi:hypothetical protein
VTSGTSITTTTASVGTNYYITTSGITGITLPVSGLSLGMFWTFQNNSGYALTITLTGGTAAYNGSTAASSIGIPTGSGITIAYYNLAGINYIIF